MSEYKFSCFICSKQTSRAAKKKHLFSKAHQQDIWNAILAKKAEMTTWIGRIEGTIPGGAAPIPYIRFGKDYTGYKVCFGCESLTPSKKIHPGFLHCPCGKLEENVQHIKDILASKQRQMPVEEIPDVPAPVVPSTTSEEEVKKLQREIATLKREKASAEKRAEEAEALSAEAFTIKEWVGNTYSLLFNHYPEALEELLSPEKELEIYNEEEKDIIWSVLKKRIPRIEREEYE